MKKPRRLAPIDLDRAFRDPALLGAALGDPSTWSAWMTVLRSAFGLELDEAQAQLFVEIAGGRQPPPKRVRELWAIVSRRCGKSKMAAGIAVFHATMMPQKVSSGEKPVVLVLASTQDQSRVVFDYALSFLQ